ncbi:MAG: site-2 protease family protein [Acidobacteriales bacterium]|nr:site-2 protease family protein [Terriglobales bacterium]
MTFDLLYILMQIAVFLFAISVHESAHAWMANRCGDPTARMLGRITLNPIKHIDPVGTVLLPAIALLTRLPVIGWAKPTPVDPNNFKNPVRDDILTSIVGPISNFVIAAGAVALMLAISVSSDEGRVLVQGLANGSLMDTGSLLTPFTLLLYITMTINVLLGVFNLIPLPPLDGSHVLRHLLPEDLRRIYDTAGMFAFLLLFLVGGRIIRALVTPVTNFVNEILKSV